MLRAFLLGVLTDRTHPSGKLSKAQGLFTVAVVIPFSEYVGLPAGDLHDHPLRGAVVDQVGGGLGSSVMPLEALDAGQAQAGLPGSLEVADGVIGLPHSAEEQERAGGRQGAEINQFG